MPAPEPRLNGWRIAVLGGRGMLGTDAAAAFAAAGAAVQTHDLPEFDLCRPEHLAAAVAAADLVVNCAAYTEVDRAESEPDRARAVNADAVGELGAIAARLGRYVLHIGTDFVFDGAQTRPYREEDRPAPLNVYGATKLAGEQALAASGCRHAVLRVQWTYGAAGRHFVGKVLERVEAGPLRMVDDQVGAPTWTRDVARALIHFLALRPAGLFHYAAAGFASRHAVAAFILRERNLTTALLPCRTADFATPARRPLNSRFDCTRFDALCPGLRRPWDEALREFLRSTP